MDIATGLKPGLVGAVIGAVVMAAVGFTMLGWVTTGSAEDLAQSKAETAVVAALVPFCVLKARHDPDQAMLTKFQGEQSSYDRSDLVTKAGWASVGDRTADNGDLAHACAEKLYTPKSS